MMQQKEIPLLPVERISGVEIGAERAVAVGTIELQRSAGTGERVSKSSGAQHGAERCRAGTGSGQRAKSVAPATSVQSSRRSN